LSRGEDAHRRTGGIRRLPRGPRIPHAGRDRGPHRRPVRLGVSPGPGRAGLETLEAAALGPGGRAALRRAPALRRPPRHGCPARASLMRVSPRPTTRKCPVRDNLLRSSLRVVATMAAFAAPASAQQRAALARPDAESKESFTRISSIRELPSGKVLVADLQDK